MNSVQTCIYCGGTCKWVDDAANKIQGWFCQNCGIYMTLGESRSETTSLG